jgi:Tfp pilus assembly protein FimT
MTVGKCRYFTLIEMIVVLIIMATMAAIVIPRMGFFYQNTSLSSTVIRFRSFLDTARMEAALNHSECRLVIHPGWRKIDMERGDGALISNPAQAVGYIKEIEQQNQSGGSTERAKREFVKAEGALGQLLLPSGVNIKYISVSGEKKDPMQKIMITFTELYQPNEINFVFENGLKDYLGLKVEANTGIVRELQVNNLD